MGPLLLLFLLPLLVTAARKSAATPAREQLTTLANNNGGVIPLDSELFDMLTAPDRDWGAVVQLTALGKALKCAPCKEFDPAFRAVGKAWKGVTPTDRDDFFFGTLDFEDGKEIFQRLQLTSAPVVKIYPAARGDRKLANGKTDPIPYEFGNSGFDPVLLASQLSRFTPAEIPYKAPPDYSKLITISTSVLSVLLLGRFSLPLVTSRWFWAVCSVGLSLVMCGGFMFVKIRGMPYVIPGQGMIAGGFQNQLGIEVQIVAFLYGVLALSFLVLTLWVPRTPSRARQRTSVYLWTSVNLILFSVLLSVFKIKNGGYPFRLFL